MPAIASSDAVLTFERVLPQHQAALTVLKDRLDRPTLQNLRWLDLACGRGQILANANHVFGHSRSKVEYVGIDVKQEFVLQAHRLAEPLFPKATVHVSELQNFESVIPPGKFFDFITFTNAAHEIVPNHLATTLVAALCRIDASGQLYLYDMESLSTPELGAIGWSGAEMEAVIKAIIEAAGELKYAPEVAVWQHSSCRGWSLQVNRQYIGCPQEHLNGAKNAMQAAALRTFRAVLQRKLVEINSALEALRIYGPSTPEEARQIAGFTSEFWSISRALDAVAVLASGAI